MDSEEYKELVDSFGGKAVGLTFNPSGLVVVEVIKVAYANIINDLHETRENAINDHELKRLCSVAITEAQTAQMWAVKAKTWSKQNG